MSRNQTELTDPRAWLRVKVLSEGAPGHAFPRNAPLIGLGDYRRVSKVAIKFLRLLYIIVGAGGNTTKMFIRR